MTGTQFLGSEVAELLGTLIRNECVSWGGFPSTGNESLNAASLQSVLEGPGLDLTWHEPVAGRASLVARIEGSDPSAPSLALVGHTDVVPAGAVDDWAHDPFGGEVIDGEVWGRGAVDMLNQTAAMALAVRRLADSGFRPRGDLVFWAVPDEECGGYQGAKLTVDTEHDLVRTDYALSEVGGAVSQGPRGPRIETYVADKGGGTIQVTVRGTQAHSSLPFGNANPVVRAAEIVRRIDTWRPPIRISDSWRRWVQAQDYDADLAAALTDTRRVDDALELLPIHVAAQAHACTRCTAVPTVINGGEKSNIIPQIVTLMINIRPTIGDDPDAIVAELRTIIEDLVEPDDIITQVNAPTESTIDTPLWDVLASVAGSIHPGAELIPTMLAAQTDARWLRPKGTVSYGFGLLSQTISPEDYWARFHGVNERIDLESLELSLRGWELVAREFLA